MLPEVITSFRVERVAVSGFAGVVVIPQGLTEAWLGQSKQPSFSPVARAGSQVFFCSSDPKV